MIAINSFIQYMLIPAANLKMVFVALFAGALTVRNRPVAQKIYRATHQIPIHPALIFILLISFFLRLFWILWSKHEPPASISEDLLIFTHAKDLALGQGFVSFWTRKYTAFRPIGYPFFLAALFKLTGIHLFPAEFLQVVFNTISIYFLFLIGGKTISPHFGLAVAFLYAINPTSIMASKILLDEHPFLMLWLGGLVLLIVDYQKPSYKKIFCAGFLIGISAVCRTYSVITCGIVFLVWLIGKRNLVEGFKRAAIVAILLITCALPWGIRNFHRLGAPILWTAAIGTNLYFANNPTSDVRYPVNPDLAHGGDPDFLNTKNTEIQTDRAGRKAAWDWIQHHPLTFLDKMIGRTFYMLGFDREGWVIEDNFSHLEPGAKPPKDKILNRLRKAEQADYVLTFLFALVGSLWFLADLKKRGDSKGFFYIFITAWFYVFSTVVALAHRKYRFPVEPFFTLLAAYGFSKPFFQMSKPAHEYSTASAS